MTSHCCERFAETPQLNLLILYWIFRRGKNPFVTPSGIHAMPPPDARAIGVGAGADGGAPRGALDRLGLFQAVVLLDVLWNVLFVAVATAVLVASVTESRRYSSLLLAHGYVLQCLLHVLCVVIEYGRSRLEARSFGAGVRLYIQ
jgi:hypothetical protein